MPERKPAGMPRGHWVDEQIRRATERGEFDHLPGAGKPLGIHDPNDEDWWVRQKVAEEEIPSDVFLPPALLLRKEVAALPDAVSGLPDEEAVRAAVREVNQRVAEHIRLPTGPPIPVGPANVEAVVAGWREQRLARLRAEQEKAEAGQSDAGHEQEQAHPRRRRWFRRR